MKIPRIKTPQAVAPYRGVIGFVFILTLSNILWKYNIKGDETDSLVTLFGQNISAPFDMMARHVAEICTSVLQNLGWNVKLNSNNVITHENGISAQVIWACSGLKQAYIYLCIMIFSRGSWLKKIWYIPLGLILVYLFNIIRISFIIAFIENHPTAFDLLHLYIFKYLYYILIFGIWVFWEEKISKPIHLINEPTDSNKPEKK